MHLASSYKEKSIKQWKQSYVVIQMLYHSFILCISIICFVHPECWKILIFSKNVFSSFSASLNTLKIVLAKLKTFQMVSSFLLM